MTKHPISLPRQQSPDMDSLSVDEPAALYRLVTGSSVTDLDLATHGLPRRRSEHRILDHFVLPLVYRHQIERAIEHSVLRRLPEGEIDEVVRQLGSRAMQAIPSLSGPIRADAVETRQFQDGVGVPIDYDAQVDEQRGLVRLTREILALPDSYDFKLGQADPHVVIVGDKLSATQIESVGQRVPSWLNLSKATS